MTVNIGGAGLPTLTWGASGGSLQGPLIFGSPTANNETIFDNPINLNGGNGTVQVNSGQGGDFAELFGAVSNTGAPAGLVKTGNGRLILAATNTYNGATIVDAGTLQVSSTANLGSGGLVFDGGGGGVFDITGTAAFNSAMPITLNNNGTIKQDDSAHVTLSGAIGGSGTLIKSDSGVLVLSGTNNYSGGTTVIGGMLEFVGASSMPGGNLSVGNDLAAFGSVISADASPGGASSLPAASDAPASFSAASPAGAGAVPEPGTAALLLALGAGGLLTMARRCKLRLS